MELAGGRGCRRLASHPHPLLGSGVVRGGPAWGRGCGQIWVGWVIRGRASQERTAGGLAGCPALNWGGRG